MPFRQNFKTDYRGSKIAASLTFTKLFSPDQMGMRHPSLNSAPGGMLSTKGRFICTLLDLLGMGKLKQ